jgi:hypothetical protein
MGLFGLATAAIFRATWRLSWDAGARGILLIIVGAATGAIGGICISRALSDELRGDIGGLVGTFYLMAFNMIIWTAGGTARRFLRAPPEPSSRSGAVPYHALPVVRWPWRTLACALCVLLVIDCAWFVVKRGKPPEPGGLGAPPLTQAEEFWTDVLLLDVINLAFLATIVGGNAVLGRFKSGRAGPGTAFFVLALLAVAFVGVGGTLALLLLLFR